MYHMNKPLFPPMKPVCDQDPCVRVPLFNGETCACSRPPMPGCKRVIVENPCRPGECAEVLLGVDECGNLVICVKRDIRFCWDVRPECPCRKRGC